MNRTERKEQEKLGYRENKKKHKWIYIILLFVLLIQSLIRVDHSFQEMTKRQEQNIFACEKVNESLYKVYFCGEKFYINEKELENKYIDVKNDTYNFLGKIKNKIICFTKNR
ncbi:hypothetical protein IZY60_00555 [Lutibacter sp. B2]|nr:hypothetical protein [Lutibacter sp. B2]